MFTNFKGSEKPTIGVEIEVQIINPTSCDLQSKSQEILSYCHENRIKGVKAEIHQSMLEIDTEICENIAAIRKSLTQRYLSLNQISQAADCKIAVLGTHPFQKWCERLFTDSKRYLAIHQKYQWLARRMNVYGMHVHIGIKDTQSAVLIMNNLSRFLPHLLALSANSPFWQGIDTGMDSCRINILESFPNAGVPKFFQSEENFTQYLETLTKSNAIDTIKDLYWFIRPNFEYGTIEFRICDANLNLEETLAVVAMIQSLVVFYLENPGHPLFDSAEKSHWIAPTNLFAAARDGLEAQIITINQTKVSIRDEIEQLVSILSPVAKQLGCYEELQSCHQILTFGNGAKKQKALHEKTEDFSQIVFSAIV